METVADVVESQKWPRFVLRRVVPVELRFVDNGDETADVFMYQHESDDSNLLMADRPFDTPMKELIQDFKDFCEDRDLEVSECTLM